MLVMLCARGRCPHDGDNQASIYFVPCSLHSRRCLSTFSLHSSSFCSSPHPSPPLQVFEYFASQRADHHSYSMTAGDMMRAVVPVYPPEGSDTIRAGSLPGEPSPHVHDESSKEVGCGGSGKGLDGWHATGRGWQAGAATFDSPWASVCHPASQQMASPVLPAYAGTPTCLAAHLTAAHPTLTPTLISHPKPPPCSPRT